MGNIVEFDTPQTTVNNKVELNSNVSSSRMTYGRFLEYLEMGWVKQVDLYDNSRNAIVQASSPELGNRPQTIRVEIPVGASQLIQKLKEYNIDFDAHPAEQKNLFVTIASNLLLPLIFIAGLVYFFQNSENFGGGSGQSPMSLGKSTARFERRPDTGVNFHGIAGIDEAKAEFEEIVSFLKQPDKYTIVGAKIPKGILLVGPPGTGKTLLAKAIANESDVPFFSVAGSEFVEMFIGIGAARVRDLFQKAAENAPCIVFIDEIDAVGLQRGAGMGGGNDEREQTINQLLTEMDGFEGNSGVIVLAATNRPDVLDSALLRPGRFDRQVTVDRPDVQGRVQILKVHSRGKVLAKDVDFDKVARRTPGFTGADLQNLMNEAAIFAARRGLTEISKEEIADALERIIAGPEKKDAVMSEKKKKLVAYHEAGHALVGALMPEYDPVTKISIVPRGAAGGLTFFAPSEERLESGLYSKSYLENQMCVALGGRIAEELIFGAEDVTTGASNDFQQVSRVARMMIETMGFSKKIGQIALKTGGGQSFLGGEMGRSADYGPATADLVDSEVKELVTKAYRRAKDLVSINIDVLHKVADVLMEKENIDGDEFQTIMLACGAGLYLKEDSPATKVPYQTA